MRLGRAMMKLQLKEPSIVVPERTKFTSPPSSPTTTLLFDDSGSEDDAPPSTTPSRTPPADIPKGFFTVYVGEDADRYVIPLGYLNHRVFLALLSRAEEEFGFGHLGALRLPCDTVFFEHLLWLLRRDDPSAQSYEMEELLKFYQ